MKNTLRLFQLLLAVFGFYAAVTYVGNLKNYVPLASLSLVWGLDKFERAMARSQKKADVEKDIAKKVAASHDKANKQLAHALRNKNVLMLTDTIEGLLWDLGLSVSRSINYKSLDRILDLEGQRGAIGLKIVSDLDESTADLEQLTKIGESPIAEKDRLRILLIANNAGELSQAKGQEYQRFSSQFRRLLADKKIIAMTTQTLHELYRLCKEKNQDPNKLFGRVYQHPGGVFRL